MTKTVYPKVYFPTNSHLYNYCSNNPVRYVDPNGVYIVDTNKWCTGVFMQMSDDTWPDSENLIAKSGCTLIASYRAVIVAINLFGYAFDTVIPIILSTMLENSSITCSKGMIFAGLAEFLKSYGVDATIIDTGKKGINVNEMLKKAASSEDAYLVIGRIPDGKDGHYVNINGYSSKDKTVNATDTSMTEDGNEKRDLKSVKADIFDRLILIKVKSLEDE